MAATPLRNVRVSDEVWEAAKERARADGRTLTDVIVGCLTDYAADPAPSRRGQRKPPHSAPLRAREPAPAKAPHRCPVKGWCAECGEMKGYS